jgi:hypothetical protein
MKGSDSGYEARRARQKKEALVHLPNMEKVSRNLNLESFHPTEETTVIPE